MRLKFVIASEANPGRIDGRFDLNSTNLAPERHLHDLATAGPFRGSDTPSLCLKRVFEKGVPFHPSPPREQPACQSRPVDLHRFLRKFVLDALPGALASLVGALFFTHQWAPAPHPVRLEPVERVAMQSEQVAQMIRDEHALDDRVPQEGAGARGGAASR